MLASLRGNSMGGKSTNSSQNVSIPPQVLAQYQTVVSQANKTAQTPFQTYGGQFVSPVNAQQTQGISGINTAANQAQPYFGAATSQLQQGQSNVNPINQAATGLMAQSAQQVNPSDLNAQSINKYLSPYLGTVLGSTEALINQQNQQAQQGALGTAINSGAFGGDRTGIAAANLNQQQELAAGNIYSGIANQGYQSALGTAQQQQGVNLSAGQANRAALANAAQGLAGIGSTAYGESANTATGLAGLGTGAQGAALQGAQAQIGAGTLQQQTQQAKDTALYNQFLQQQSYPFQIGQWLANISEGTGALSGSNTTTTQPGGFFSDKRLKHDIKKIGKTYDGQHIYSYKMHGDDRTHVGLIAQEVEKKHPEATGVAGNYKIVDYGKATEDAANRGHFYTGGVVPIHRGGAVEVPGAYAVGGNPVPQYAGMPSSVSPVDLSAILQAQRDMFAPYSGGKGIYGSESGGPYGGVGHVPPPSGAVAHLITAQGSPQRQPSVMENTKSLTDLAGSATKLYRDYQKSHPDTAAPGVGNDSFSQNVVSPPGGLVPASTEITTQPESALHRGGRTGLAQGGLPYSSDPNPSELDIPDTTNSQQLKTAGPLPQQKSGFENLMNLVGTAAATYGAYAGGAAAMAAKLGGRVGYADGGSPDDPTNGDTLLWPEGSDERAAQNDRMSKQDLTPIVPPSTAEKLTPPAEPSGVAPATDAATIPMKTAGLAPPTDTGKNTDHWYSKAENIVPILTGLAAMGTAPTRSLGVALSAGLGAGASTWQPSHMQQAEIEQQQLQNQKTQYQLGLLKNPQPLNQTANPPTPGLSGLTGGVDPASIRSVTQSLYQIPNTYTPEESQAIAKASALQNAGMPNNLQAIQSAHAARMQTLQQNATYAANRTYQEADAIVNADPNQAFSMLQRLNPSAAADIQRIASSRGVDPDKLARAYANEVGSGSHQYSGRGDPLVSADGQIRDKPTGHIMLGGVPVGMNAAEMAQMRIHLATPVDIGAAAKPALGSTQAGHAAAVASGLVPGSGGTTAGPTGLSGSTIPLATTPAATIPAPSATAPIPVSRPQRQTDLISRLRNPDTANAYVAGTPGASPTAPVSAAANTAGSKNLDYSDVPEKPAWADNPNAVAPEGQGELYGKQKAALLAESGGIRETQQQQVNVTRMLNELPNAKVGPGSRYLADAQTLLGNLTGSQFTSWVNSNPAAYDLLAKGLGNDALQTTLARMREGGASVRLGAQESNLILNKLSASPEMSKGAIRSLLNWQQQQLAYEKDRQNAIPGYLAHGGDAREGVFDNWYSNKRPLQGAVSTAPAAGTTVGGAKPMPSGTTLQHYADTHFSGDTGKAQQFLQSQGYR